jgi:hypothetical protein
MLACSDKTATHSDSLLVVQRQLVHSSSSKRHHHVVVHPTAGINECSCAVASVSQCIDAEGIHVGPVCRATARDARSHA